MFKNRQPEQDVQADTLYLAALLGWDWYHPYHSMKSREGYPDLTLWHPIKAMILFREMKSARGHLSEDQVKVGWGLLCAGADWDVWGPEEWQDGTVEAVLRGDDKDYFPVPDLRMIEAIERWVPKKHRRKMLLSCDLDQHL